MTGSKLVLVAESLTEPGLSILTGDEALEVREMSDGGRKALLAALPGASALVVRGATRVDGELLAAGPELEAVARAGVGVDNIDVEEASRRGVAVLNAPTGNTRSAAELTVGLILALHRRIPEADRAVREGRWHWRRELGVELHPRTLGIVGLGRIGSAVAARIRPFGVELLASDPYLDADGRRRARRLGVERVELEELLPRSQIVSLHVPLTDETRGMIGAEALTAMQPGAFLVNTSRGEVVDEEALARALAEERVAGAALDVLSREPPPPDHPLLGAPNVVFTPHVGGATEEAKRAVSREVAEALRSLLLEGTTDRAVNSNRL